MGCGFLNTLLYRHQAGVAASRSAGIRAISHVWCHPHAIPLCRPPYPIALCAITLAGTLDALVTTKVCNITSTLTTINYTSHSSFRCRRWSNRCGQKVRVQPRSVFRLGGRLDSRTARPHVVVACIRCARYGFHRLRWHLSHGHVGRSNKRLGAGAPQALQREPGPGHRRQSKGQLVNGTFWGSCTPAICYIKGFDFFHPITQTANAFLPLRQCHITARSPSKKAHDPFFQGGGDTTQTTQL